MNWRRDPLPQELLDDDRTWHGDHDPYLARLAHEGHGARAKPTRAAERVAGPPDDGDPYLAELARRCRGPAGE